MSLSLHPEDMLELTSFGAEVPLMPITGCTDTIALEVISATAGSTLTVKTARKGTTRALTVNPGDRIEGRFLSIVSVSGVTRVRVYW